MKKINPWDAMSAFFNTDKPMDEIPSDVADNIVLSWPVILDGIRAHAKHRADSRALDFGCGAGLFTAKLASLGFETVGVDTSRALIAIAERAHGNAARFVTGGSEAVGRLGTFTVITSLMTFQFIENIAQTLRDLYEALEDEGVLIFSVFNPDYVRNALAVNRQFFDFDFDADGRPTRGFMELVDDARVPTFVRTAEDYNRMARGLNLRPLFAECPPFTPEFLAQYGHEVPTTDPEYLILGYQK